MIWFVFILRKFNNNDSLNSMDTQKYCPIMWPISANENSVSISSYSSSVIDEYCNCILIQVSIVRRHTSSSSEEGPRGGPLSAKEYVESLHQNAKSQLLYGKNNVIVQPVSVIFYKSINKPRFHDVFLSCTGKYLYWIVFIERVPLAILITYV